MAKSRSSDWPAVFFFLLLVGALRTAFTPSLVKAQEPPFKDGCRAVSKLEYVIAKREYVLSARRQIPPERSFLAALLLVVSRLAKRPQMGQWLIADLSFSDVHFQLWMLLLAAFMLLWFVYVWTTR